MPEITFARTWVSADTRIHVRDEVSIARVTRGRTTVILGTTTPLVTGYLNWLLVMKPSGGYELPEGFTPSNQFKVTSYRWQLCRLTPGLDDAELFSDGLECRDGLVDIGLGMCR